MDQRLEELAAKFDKLISLIPSKQYYVDAEQNHRFKQNKSQKAEFAKQSKRAKLDPDNDKTVIDIQKEEAEESEEEKPMQLNIKVDDVPTIMELKERLRAKIEFFQTQRQGKKENYPRDRKMILEERANRKQKKTEEQKKKTVGNVEKLEPKKKAAPEIIKKDDSIPIEGGSIEFGKIKGVEKTEKKKKLEPKVALKKLEEKKRKLSEIEAVDKEKAKKIKHDEAWRVAISKADGTKVKDEERLLKKTIKRKEKQKVKSKEEWKDRKTAVQSQMEERQKKRTENIQKKIDSKKANADKKQKRPGFEGTFKTKGKKKQK